jgi:hypothetical protein
MKKAFKRFLACVLTVIMVFSFATTVFATGEALVHNGTSTKGYYTSDYVEQKNDKRLHCNNAYKTPTAATMGVFPVMSVNGEWVKCAQNTSLVRYFQTGQNIMIGTYSSVRRIHLRIYNMGSYEGTSVSTSGSWTLYGS